MDPGVDQVTLTFREQSDGRKVARLGTGKVVLVHYTALDKVKDGESWLVRLDHQALYAVAHPLERINKPAEAPKPVVPVPARASTTVVLAKDRDPVVKPPPAPVVVQ